MHCVQLYFSAGIVVPCPCTGTYYSIRVNSKEENLMLWGIRFKNRNLALCSCCLHSCWNFPFAQILHQYCGPRLPRPHLPRPEPGLPFWKCLAEADGGCAVPKEWTGTAMLTACRDQGQVQPCMQHAEIRDRYSHACNMQRSGTGTAMRTRCRDPGRVQSCAQDAEVSRVSDPG